MLYIILYIEKDGAAVLGSVPGSSAFIYFLLSFAFSFTHITSALITYDKGTLLDIGQRYTNLFQDTLSSNLSWPLEILQNEEENNGHLNDPRRWRIKKHRGKRWEKDSQSSSTEYPAHQCSILGE